MKCNLQASLILSLTGFIFSFQSIGLGINVNGNLIITPPECILNNDKKEMIHFGDILLTRIDGVNYKHKLPFELSCTNLVKNNLTLSIQGEASNFANGTLRTSNSKLGMNFYINGVKQDINKKVNVKYLELPLLEVAPVKNINSNFEDTDGGDFTAFATLKVDYQ